MPLSDFDLDSVTTLLVDADGTLFASEEPAFDASVKVANACLSSWGVAKEFSAEELRLRFTGHSFRSTLTALARRYEMPVDQETFLLELDRWVAEENAVVTRHLAEVLTPDSEVLEPLGRLNQRFRLAVVSSSASSRIDRCLDSVGLSELFGAERRFSAQDSLPVPTSKPDPAVYTYAGAILGVTATEAIAIEDALPGAESAVRAGFCTIGLLTFVSEAERPQRVADLQRLGVSDLASSWSELERLLVPADSGAESS